MGDKSISVETVQQVAGLARIRLEPKEAERLAIDMGRMLEYVAKLEELDTSDVPPTSHAIDLGTVWRNDEAAPGLTREQIFQNAPEPIGEGFGVPKIIE